MSRWTRRTPRLLLDSAIVILLPTAFAYWWLGNLVHEIVGTVFFLLLIRHLVNNGRWWLAIRRGSYDLRRRLSLVLTLMLAVVIGVLLLTSVLISQSVFVFLPQPGLFTMRELHWFSAYWVMAIVGLHLGVNWNRVNGLFRDVIGPTGRTRLFAILGLVSAIAIAAQGYLSASVLGLWPRLSFQYSIAMWDFTASVLPFFGHWLAILGLFAFIGHAALCLTNLARTMQHDAVQAGR